REPVWPWPSGARVVAAAGGALLACLALSAVGAPAPLLSLALLVKVGCGLLAYFTIARRPRLARWLLLGAGCLIVAELPLVLLQQATQSTFPAGTLLYRWPAGGSSSSSRSRARRCWRRRSGAGSGRSARRDACRAAGRPLP